MQIKQLRISTVRLPESHPERGGDLPVFGYLIRDGDEVFLVDTGVGSGSTIVDRMYSPDSVSLVDLLRQEGLRWDQLSGVINSHLHFDHCGNNRLFPGVPIYVQKQEFQAAQEPRYTVSNWVIFPGCNYQLVDGRRFVTAHIELVPTPGHTIGHQSVLVHRSSDIDLIVAQASYTAAEFERSRTGAGDIQSGNWSDEAYCRSLSLLHSIGAQRAFFSHDEDVWEAAT
jgi:N-acyl homoserine lactone hydrolase